MKPKIVGEVRSRTKGLDLIFDQHIEAKQVNRKIEPKQHTGSEVADGNRYLETPKEAARSMIAARGDQMRMNAYVDSVELADSEAMIAGLREITDVMKRIAALIERSRDKKLSQHGFKDDEQRAHFNN